MKRTFVFLCLVIFLGLVFTYQSPFLAYFDVKILLFFEDMRTPFLNGLFTIITTIGSIKVLFPLCICVSIYLVFKKYYAEVICLWILFWSSRGLNFILKKWIERERPAFHPLIEIGEYSFPSGHSMNAIVVIGFLCYLLTTNFVINKTWRSSWFLITGIIILLIVLSRLYLGVHYLTDVVAGLCIGYLLLVFFLHFFPSVRKKWLADRR
ncbi:phosphatase PAP2 family protein [Bacillus sp. SD088]|uniref:phosphatase PAP2 family protein n=1 Tax=Bacillus sp. SD088 TaxID=2782012 RepID=UPI001A972AA4|nr:phosphatase PAP2 family protein [Bacillus sp. SD088]MBO0991739.1 phosphatase PAP2 family protein [Bacillus sp. SD088]